MTVATTTTEIPHAVLDHIHPEPTGFVRKYIFSIDHKIIAFQYFITAGIFFVIAGLLDNRVTNVANKVPWLGDIPIIGNFFKSKSDQKSNSELMVLCTVHRVAPSVVPPKGPTMPVPNLDPKKFDKDKSGATK